VKIEIEKIAIRPIEVLLYVCIVRQTTVWRRITQCKKHTYSMVVDGLWRKLIPRLHDRANIEQTSSKRRANIQLARPANISPARQASLIV